MEPVRLVQSRVVHEALRPRISVRCERYATPDGEIERTVVHHPGAVAILAQPAPGRVLLVRQWRYAIRRWTLEIPAGTREPGEPERETALRELQEETGLRAGRMSEILRFYPSLGLMDEELVIFRAEGLSPVAMAPDPGELVRPVDVAVAELAGLRAQGELCDAKTLIALALLGVPLVGGCSC